MNRGFIALLASVVGLAGCANGSFGESAASGIVQGALGSVGLDVVTSSLGGDIVQGANRAAYRARTESEAANTPRPDNGVVPKMSATQGALNNLNMGQPRIQVDSPNWKPPTKGAAGATPASGVALSATPPGNVAPVTDTAATQ
ncbi:hypothetical protein [Burkholderia cepacia]|uniref:hypothetical protein n=1 Tax=Burkholderia cepacia TaxID=292 RepID=UPI002AB7BF8F|nr:hypothetical protein [Burkholderia cepacia]